MSPINGQVAVKINCLTLLGIGTVGSAIIQILPHYLDIKKVHIVDRVPDLSQHVKKLISNSLNIYQTSLQNIEFDLHCIELDQSNIRQHLFPLFQESQAVLDLTTMIDSETVAKLADECQCVYLNACLETFHDGELSEAHRHAHFRNIKDGFVNTMILESGMNPGLISLLLNKGLADSNLDYDCVDTVHITEYDTHHLLSSRKSKNVFYNTWSPFGLYEEAIKKAEMAWPLNLDPPNGWERDHHLIVHSNKAGYEVCTQSITPQWISNNEWRWTKYYGFIITHGEVETISNKLGKQIKCAFVFRTCPEATHALQKWKKERAPVYQMMSGYDIDHSFEVLETSANAQKSVDRKGARSGPPADNIGVLIISKKNKKAWWTGTMMQLNEAQRVSGLNNNGANITVAAGCLSMINWALRYPHKGMLFPDDLDSQSSKDILELSQPFLGQIISQEIPYDWVSSIDDRLIIVEPGNLNIGCETGIKHIDDELRMGS